MRGYADFRRYLRPGLYAHTAQALGASRYPLHSLTLGRRGFDDFSGPVGKKTEQINIISSYS